MKTMLTVLFLMFSTVAQAQEFTWIAQSYYQFGEGYFEQGDYPSALGSFQMAYKFVPLPEYAYDVALAHYKMDNVYAARTWLRIYYHNKLTKAEVARGDKLAAILLPLIDEDFNANGLTFSCSRMETKLQHCGIHQWPKDELATYQLWVRKQQ